MQIVIHIVFLVYFSRTSRNIGVADTDIDSARKEDYINDDVPKHTG